MCKLLHLQGITSKMLVEADIETLQSVLRNAMQASKWSCMLTRSMLAVQRQGATKLDTRTCTLRANMHADRRLRAVPSSFHHSRRIRSTYVSSSQP